MPQIYYQLFAGTEQEVKNQIALEASKGTGKPVLLTATSGPDGIRLFVVFEKPVVK